MADVPEASAGHGLTDPTARSGAGFEDPFKDRFGASPTALVRAPGRVNLIGEHIDYNGLGVLPMAIDRAVSLVLRPRTDSVIALENEDPAFESVRFEASADLVRGTEGSWENYPKAAARGLAIHFGPLRGFDGLVSSDLPAAAGLSSSSALVVAVGLALARLNDLPLDRMELARAMAEAERFVGTAGGGMDQAVALGAEEGHAVRIDFGPLRIAPLRVPDGWMFVVAHSLAQAEKSGRARSAYNARTKECAEAFRCVAAGWREASGEAVGSYAALLAAAPGGELLRIASSRLDATHLRRFRHVVTEAERVDRAAGALGRGDLEAFGALMNASHESLRDDYEVSAPALDELVERAVTGGAAGARLTGAGFGGCVIALCARDGASPLLEALGAFYEKRGARPTDGRLFRVRPSGGATFEELLPSP